jgi:hypothetical protein
MTTRRASCCCGQLHLMIEGEPSRISMCHCLECQRRTGSVISNQARFGREQITIGGEATPWMRAAESGNTLTFYFCPTCGSTVYWENEGFPGIVAVATAETFLHNQGQHENRRAAAAEAALAPPADTFWAASSYLRQA